MSQSSNPETTPPDATRKLLDLIFELDAKYQGNIIKAANRDAFINERLCPLVNEYVVRCVRETLR